MRSQRVGHNSVTEQQQISTAMVSPCELDLDAKAETGWAAELFPPKALSHDTCVQCVTPWPSFCTTLVVSPRYPILTQALSCLCSLLWTCSGGVFLLLVLSPQLPPRTLLHSLLPQATPSSQECFSYLYSGQDSWQFYSESQDSCNLEQAAGWEEELGSPWLNWEEGRFLSSSHS